MPSGEARVDDGVGLLVFLGIMLGLGCVKRGNVGSDGTRAAPGPLILWRGLEISSCGVAIGRLGKFIVAGTGGACIMLSRCNRLVSVGLIVLAPKPEGARPEMTD